jgi:hypothetical protein
VATAPDEWVVDFPTMWVVPDWIERHCPVPDGFRKGQQLELYSWQLWCTVNHYRIKPTATFGQLAPAFFYRRSQVVAPQKTGKGPWSATIICNEAVGPAVFSGWAQGGEQYRCRNHGCRCGWVYEYAPGEPMGRPWPTPLIQLLATSEDQVENVYRPLKAMVKAGPLKSMMRVGEEFIRLPNDGKIDVVTSSALSRLGNPINFALQDETGLYTPTNKMVKVAETQRRGAAGMGGRAMETTNAWDPSENSTAQRTSQSLRPDIFRFHRVPPARLSYRNKRERLQIHRYVYAGSEHVDLDAIEAEAAELLETDPAQAERFFGNRTVAGVDSWLQGGRWEEREALKAVKPKTKICIGFDGSDTGDWTGFRAETLDGYQFTPTYGPDDLPTYWDPKQFGGEIPRSEVDAALDHLMTYYTVVRGYFDVREWKTEIEGWQLKYGTKRVVKWETNRPVQMHAALQRFAADLPLVITHDGCKQTAIHIGNARRVARPSERYILGKPSPHQKIDLAMCSVLVHEARCDAVLGGAKDEPTRRRVMILN